MKRVFFYYYWWPLILVFEIRCHFLFSFEAESARSARAIAVTSPFFPSGCRRPSILFFFSFLLHCLYWLPSLWRLDCSAENQLTVAWKCAISWNAKPEDTGGGYTSSGRNSSLETDMIRQWKPPSQSGALNQADGPCHYDYQLIFFLKPVLFFFPWWKAYYLSFTRNNYVVRIAEEAS